MKTGVYNLCILDGSGNTYRINPRIIKNFKETIVIFR